MKEIYLLVMYYPNDKEAGRNVETHLGYFADKKHAEGAAEELNQREGFEEKYFVRTVKPA